MLLVSSTRYGIRSPHKGRGMQERVNGYLHSSGCWLEARMDIYPENRLTTIPAKAPLEADGIPLPSLVSPFGKGGLRGISLHSWMPDQVRHGTVGCAAYVKVNFKSFVVLAGSQNGQF
jgi:hypothetical protein